MRWNEFESWTPKNSSFNGQLKINAVDCKGTSHETILRSGEIIELTLCKTKDRTTYKFDGMRFIKIG